MDGCFEWEECMCKPEVDGMGYCVVGMDCNDMDVGVVVDSWYGWLGVLG